MGITKTYSHAAPFIRESLVRAVHSANAARTQRDRAKYFAEAFAYGQTLNIMRLSSDQAPAPGIHRLWAIAPGTVALEEARAFLGGSADDILGTQAEIEAAEEAKEG
jgi:hypothetical protein